MWEFICGVAVGAVTMVLFLVLLKEAVFAERDAQVRLASPIPDKIEPRTGTRTVTPHEPAPISTHPRHLTVYVGRPIRQADVLQFPRRWEERSH